MPTVRTPTTTDESVDREEIPSREEIVCREVIRAGAELTVGEEASLLAWLRLEGRSDESLTAFLVRSEVLTKAAAKEIGYAAKGYLQITEPVHCFAGDGLANLRRALARFSVLPAPPIESPSRPTIEPVRESTASKLPPPLPKPVELPAIGAVLAGYRLLRQIGRGPRTYVYEAEEVRLRRTVALKILAPELVVHDPSRGPRFLREAGLSRRVGHQGCLEAFSVHHEAGLYFVAMPLSPEGSAQDRLQRNGPFTPMEALCLVQEAAEILAVAHAAGITHGNLKPSNLLLGADGGLRLADFVFRADQLACPERLPTSADLRDDLRRLGMTFVWLLTGRPPATGLTGLDGRLIGAAGTRSLPDLGLPTACTRLIEGTLTLDPEREFGDIDDFLAVCRCAEAELRPPPPPISTKSNMQSVPSSPNVTPIWSRGSSAVPIAPSPLRPREPEIGQVLGKCLLIERVGKGACGIIYRALHQTLNIAVAVKILQLPDGPPSAMVLRQFRTEAQLLAQLNHPNIVRVWDFDDQGPIPYLVLEFVEGLNLAELIQQSGRVRLDRALEIIIQTAEALAAAYRIGIVHRDVKPANILLARDATVKLADLGLAMLVGPNESSERIEAPAGTVAYMAPEQATSASTVNHRADIYALGVTMYQTLTGRLPFDGRTRMEVLIKHAKQPPIPPHELAPELPSIVSSIVLRMMAKEAKDRYADYDELLRALHELRGSITSQPMQRTDTSSKTATRPVDSGQRQSIWQTLFGATNRGEGRGGAE